MGTPEIAVPTLQALLAHPDFDVAGVVTQPDRKAGRGRKLKPSPVKEAALAAGVLTILQPARLREYQAFQTLAALEYVDAVIIFDELTAHHLLAALQPEIYAKGGDYVLDPGRQGTLLPEAPLVQRYGGHIELIPYRAGYSTSELIKRITERYCD
jgi:hypothetical protein